MRGGLWLGSFAVVGGRSFEHQRSPSERLTEEPPPWASPDRTAWAVAWTAWVMLWERRMRCAQAGGPPAFAEPAEAARSEESRVGKGCVSTCGSWWSPYR